MEQVEYKMFSRHSSGGIKNPVGYMNFKVRKEVLVVDTNMKVFRKKVVFRLISQEEIIEGVSVDREEKRTNNQVLGHTSIKTSKKSG